VASNLTSIGLVCDTEASFDQLMQHLVSSAQERLASDPGDYSIWRAHTGAEVWFHITGTRAPDGQLHDHEIIGFTPFFEGMSDVDIEIDAGFQRPGENPFEGGFKAWVAPDPSNGRGVHPIVFDCIDFAAHRNRELPIRCHAKLTAFARQITVHDEDDTQQRTDEPTPTANPLLRSFVPIGMRRQQAHPSSSAIAVSASDQGQHGLPSSDAVIVGSVIEHRLLADPGGGTPFHWLLVDSLAASFDVVADPSVITGTITEGCMVEVRCTVFGRLID
jgi:hypothetical protein